MCVIMIRVVVIRVVVIEVIAVVEASDSIRIADLTLEIEIFVRIMSRSSLLSCTKISMEI